MAVVRFAAFAAGVSVGEVSMVGGVHVLAGRKRTVETAEERVVAQRDERGARQERREQRRTEAQRADETTTRTGSLEYGRRRDDEPIGGNGNDGSDGEVEFGGAGAWGAGGLGDRTGVG